MLGHTFPEKLEYSPPFSGLVSNFYLRRDIEVADHEDPSTMQKQDFSPAAAIHRADGCADLPSVERLQQLCGCYRHGWAGGEPGPAYVGNFVTWYGFYLNATIYEGTSEVGDRGPIQATHR